MIFSHKLNIDTVLGIFLQTRGEDSRVKVQKAFWRCVKSTIVPDIEENISKVMNDATNKAILKKDPKYWCKVFLETLSKSILVENNMSKIFNDILIKARYKLVMKLLEEIRLIIMKKIVMKRTIDRRAYVRKFLWT